MSGWSPEIRRRALLGLAVLAGLTFATPAYASTSEAVYVASNSNSTIAQFTIGPGGALTAGTPASVPTVDTPASVPPTVGGSDGIATSPNGLYVYMVNGSMSGAGGVSQFTVGAGGTLSPDTPLSVNGGDVPWAIAVSPDGQYAYAANSDDGSIFQYTIGAGGELTQDSGATVYAWEVPDAIAISPNGQDAYVANDVGSANSANGISQYTIGVGGMLTPDSPATAASADNPSALVVSPNGQYVYVADYGRRALARRHPNGRGGRGSSRAHDLRERRLRLRRKHQRVDELIEPADSIGRGDFAIHRRCRRRAFPGPGSDCCSGR